MISNAFSLHLIKECTILHHHSSVKMSTSDCELTAFKWATSIGHNDIYHWYDNYYVVPSSNNQIAPSTWLNIYLARSWLTFDDFLIWLQSCWIVVPLESCTCPIGLKMYACKHSVGLAIKFNLYQVSDQTRIHPLGKRKTRGRPKKVGTALHCN